MRSIIVLSLLLLTLPLSASNLWFDPPNPTSRTFVIARIQAMTGCPVSGVEVASTEQAISIVVTQFEVCPAIPAPIEGYPVSADLGFLAAGSYRVTVATDKRLLAESTLIVAEGAPVLRMFPDVAPESGGEEVTIVGAGIAPVCALAPCPGPEVLFGGVAPTILRQIDTDRIVVRVPPHAPGAVDVTITGFGRTFRAIAGFHYFAPGGARDAALFEPVLFPVMVQGTGAFGSRWSTEAVMRNENDFTFPLNSIFDSLCVPPCDPRVPAHATGLSSPSLPSGYLIDIPRQASPRIFFATLVRDLSRQAEALGTEIPVVREKDFFDRPFSILNVPTDARYRVALRLYRIDEFTTMRVRISPMDSQDEPFVDTSFVLTTIAAFSTSYIGDLVASYPQLAGRGPLRIDIESRVPSRASWGFVSVTNNETQHVTVISPQ